MFISITVSVPLPGEEKKSIFPLQEATLLRILFRPIEAGRIYNVTIKILPVIEVNNSAEVAQKIAENRKNTVFEIKKQLK
jgi:hypothetical protein